MARILLERGLLQSSPGSGAHRLLAVGSIMGLSHAGDTIWGAGVNARDKSLGAAPDLDVRAVRGPVTKRLLEGVGTIVPAVYGDPALLWPRYWPKEHYGVERSSSSVSFVPHFLEPSTSIPRSRSVRVVRPLGDPHRIVAKIANSRLVISSSLHGIIIAEAYGIPARLLLPKREPSLKYEDYYQSTGRPIYVPAKTITEALDLGGEPPIEWEPEPLLTAFPNDLFQG